MAFILADTKKVPVSVAFIDAAGNPARVDGVPVWSSSDPSVVTIDGVSEDGMSAFAVAVGPLGTAQVSVAADADLGEGIRALTGVLDIEVQASEAVSANVAAGEPVDK